MTAKYFNVKNGLTTGTISLNAANGNITSNTYIGNVVVTNTANLGAVGNLTITGGSANYVLQTNGSGSLTWVAQRTTVTVDNFTGNGVQTAFTLSTTPSSINDTIVNYNGALVLRTAYSLAGAVLTFSSPPANQAEIEITTGGPGGGGGGSSSALTWNIASSNATMSTSNGYFVDTSSAAKTMTLPSSATLGDTIRINDLAGSFSTNNLTVARNGHKIQGIAQDLLVDVDQSSFGLVYSNSTYGWKVLEL